ncbi:hypothetical protein BHE74_00039311, partial [Ensete ventricosum]
MEAIAVDEGEEIKIRKAIGEGEGELDHYIIDMVNEGIRKYKVRDDRDEDIEEEDNGLKDHC